MDINGKIVIKFRPEMESDRYLARLIITNAYRNGGKKYCVKVLTDVLGALDISTAYSKLERDEIKKTLYNDFWELLNLSIKTYKGGYDE